jgi:hypothetical protein
MRLTAVLIASGAAFAAISASAIAQSTKQPDAQESPAATQRDPGQGGQTRSPSETPNRSEAQPQGSTGPLETRSGGASASSPQGETPPGMQSVPRESPKERAHGNSNPH